MQFGLDGDTQQKPEGFQRIRPPSQSATWSSVGWGGLSTSGCPYRTCARASDEPEADFKPKGYRADPNKTTAPYFLLVLKASRETRSAPNVNLRLKRFIETKPCCLDTYPHTDMPLKVRIPSTGYEFRQSEEKLPATKRSSSLQV